MDKVAMYKEQIYKEAGVFKDFAEGAKKWSRNAKDAFGDMKRGYTYAGSYQEAARDTFNGAKDNFKKSYNKGFNDGAKSSTQPTSLFDKYDLGGATTKAEVNTAIKKHILKNHPDKFHSQFGGDTDKMKEIHENYVKMVSDFDKLKKSPEYDKLAFVQYC